MSLRSSVPDSHNAASVAAKIAQEAMETAQAASSGAHHSGGRASLSDRCAALIIDGFVALILMLPLSMAAEAVRPLVGPWVAYIGVTVVWITGLITGNAWLEASRWRATIGKRLCGLGVVDLSGRRLGYRRAATRNFAKFGIPAVVIALHYAARGRRDGAALHDRTTGTKVVSGNWREPRSPSSNDSED